MTKTMTCVSCPLGCTLTLEVSGDELISVKGNGCKRGIGYAQTELTNPVRSLTTTIRSEGGRLPVVPVKSSKPIPKDKIFECMKIINSAKAKSPIKIGDIIVKNIFDTGIDIIATNIN